MGKIKINKLLNDPELRWGKIDLALTRALQKQKESGKEFISDQEIDNLIDTILKESIDNKN